MADREETIDVLVVDDHPVVRVGLVGLIEAAEDMRVVGEADSLGQCLESLRSLRPDAVLLDLELRDCIGTEAVVKVREQHPDIALLVYTAHAAESRVADAIRAGAKGYALKESPAPRLLEGLRAVAKGESFLDPSVAGTVMGILNPSARHGESAPQRLSRREHTVLRLMAAGKRNREISEELYISERTVKWHVSAMLGKLNATNRTEAVRNAAAWGLIELERP